MEEGVQDSAWQDYTVASALEKFAAAIESCVTTWSARTAAAEGQGSLQFQAQLQHRLPFRAEPYTLTLHVAPALAPADAAAAGLLCAPLADSWALRDAPHRVQQWLGVGSFLLLTPPSYSGRVLEEEEAHTLLSAAAVALSHARTPWPLLLPVQDGVRDAYRGVAVTPAAGGEATFKFDSDSLHSSRLAPGLLRLDSQLLLFARHLSAAGAPAAAAACRAAAGTEPDAPPASMAAAAAASGSACALAAEGRRVSLALRHCYALPEAGEEGGSSEDSGSGGRGGGEWDEQAPWRPWAAQADPVGCLELDVVWRYASAADALAALAPADDAVAAVAAVASTADLVAERAPEPSEAAEWRLLALSSTYERDSGQRGLVLRPVVKPRRFLQLQPLDGGAAPAVLGGRLELAADLLPGDSSFFGMLLRLQDSCRWAAQAPALGELAGADWWARRGPGYQPQLAPDWVLQEATRDVFQMAVLPVWPAFPPGTVAWPSSTAGEHACLGKAAPLGSLISRLALHALALGSPRSLSELWSRFVRELRHTYWEQLAPLPRMRLGEAGQPEAQRAAAAATAADWGGEDDAAACDAPPPPNLGCCLLHQKLQLLDLCIHRLRQQAQQQTQQAQQGASLPAEPAAGDKGWGWDSERDEAAAPRHSGSPPTSATSSSSFSSYFSAAGGSGGQSPSPSKNPSKGQLAPAPPGNSADDDDADSKAAPAAAAAAAPAAATAPGEPSQQAAERGANGAAPARKPQGAVGELPGASLHLHPDRPLRVPAVQEPPAQTEDLLAEEQATLQALPAGGGGASALRAQLQGRMLLSDMQAFKAANPGCCLLDFVRWHSPKDCVQAGGGGWQLSKRMAAEGNAWQQLWAAAAALPAARQRPLLDPRLEGERALHFLETLPPAALFSELLAVGYSAAVVLLRTAPVAELPAVRRQVEQLAEVAEAELMQGVAAVAGDVPPASSLQQQRRRQQSVSSLPNGDAVQPGGSEGSDESSEAGSEAANEARARQQHPSWLHSVFINGLGAARYRRLLLLLGCAEQGVVAAHSLLLRLGGGEAAAAIAPSEEQQQGDGSNSGSKFSSFAVATVNALVATALGQLEMQHCTAGGAPAAPAAVAHLPPAHWPAAEALVVQRWEDEPRSAGSRDGSESEPAEWPEPFQREWLLQVHAVPASAGSGGDGSGTHLPQVGAVAAAGCPPAVLQRMYFKALPSEVRVATALAAEPCGLA